MKECQNNRLKLTKKVYICISLPNHTKNIMPKIGIIGGGASSIILSLNLIKYDCNQITVFEKDNQKNGIGLAYSSKDQSHLLNVPSKDMSLFEKDGMDFKNWLDDNYPDNYSGDDFCPRYIFGQYLSDHLKNLKSNTRFDIMNEQVLNISRENEVETTKGKYNFDFIILAFGNLPPSIPFVSNPLTKKMISDPWDIQTYTSMKDGQDIIILGNGLTAIDCLLSISNSNVKVNKIYSISRHGYMPMSHDFNLEKVHDLYPKIRNNSLSDMIYVLETEPGDIRSKIDSLSENIQSIWKNMNNSDKKTFLSEFKTKWNVINHRAPISVLDKIREISYDRISANLSKVNYKNGKFDVFYTIPNDDFIFYLRADKIINCTGPETNYKKVDDILIKNLLNSAIISPNRFGLTINTDGYNVVDRDGRVNSKIFAIGSILKGQLLESNSIPQIRSQARQISDLISDLN